MIAIKALLWILLVLHCFATKIDDTHERYRFSIQVSVVLICLTIIYTFGK